MRNVRLDIGESIFRKRRGNIITAKLHVSSLAKNHEINIACGDSKGIMR
jgi:hypothetical protein